MAKRKPVPKTRNAGTWTEAQYWSAVRSALRKGFRYWKPITQCKMQSRRAYKGPNKRQKWEYQCNHCKKWFMEKDIQIDHIIPVGTLTRSEDLPGFLRRLTVEDGFQTLCKPCHQIKTNEERKK
jgi:5-methylcytosine-specific restriction endonuclease McrA